MRKARIASGSATVIFDSTLSAASMKFGVAGAVEQPRPDRDRLDLVCGEHQRRQMEFALQDIAQARRALDRHAAGLQRGHIAVDRPDGDLELRRQGRRGDRARRGAGRNWMSPKADLLCAWLLSLKSG